MIKTIGGFIVSVKRRGGIYDVSVNGEHIASVRGKKRLQQKQERVEKALKAAQRKMKAPSRISETTCRMIAKKIERDIDNLGVELDEEQRLALMKLHMRDIVKNAAYAAMLHELRAKYEQLPEDVRRKVFVAMAGERNEIPPLRLTDLQFLHLKRTEEWEAPHGWKGYFQRSIKYASNTARDYLKTNKVNAAWRS